MAKTRKIISLNTVREIPFNKLVLSQANVRRVKAGLSIEELAADIFRRGLLQNLVVRPVLDEDGNETGTFEIPAGGRRFRALELLVKEKKLTPTTPIPCMVRAADGEILAEEDSLAENIQRVALHPLDQFRAFQAMRAKGMGEEAIAAAFFVSAQVVRQRLKLAAVSPRLLDLYAEDGMSLEQLMAFTISDDPTRQEQVWNSVKEGWQNSPYQIRRRLTETTVPADDRRARFVGIEAYQAAGGAMLRDLFAEADDVYLADPALLDRLVAEKLKAAADIVAAEGWKWVETALRFPYGFDQGLRQLNGTRLDLSGEEQAACRARGRAGEDRRRISGCGRTSGRDRCPPR